MATQSLDELEQKAGTGWMKDRDREPSTKSGPNMRLDTDMYVS